MIMHVFQEQWINRLKEAQDKYKEACKRNPDETSDDKNPYDEVPSSPHVQMPASLKSNVTSPPKSPSTKKETQGDDSSLIEALGGAEGGKTEAAAKQPVSRTSSLASSISSLPTSTSTGRPRRKAVGHVSLSPPPIPSRGRRRLGTLKALHDRCKSEAVMHVHI